MANKQMPKDTILFVSKDKNKLGLGYSYDYFNNNLVSPSSAYQLIYYKAGNGRLSWIDYKRAIQLKPGTRDEMIAAALADPEFHIDFREIPPSYVYDGEGEVYRTYYSPYDGYYDTTMWIKRYDDDLNLEAINREMITPDTDLDHHIIYYWDGDDLYVQFPEVTSGIDNAIISINMLFLDYIKLSSKLIVYRNIKPNTPKYFGWNPDNGRTSYEFRFNVYKWQDLRKENPINPISIMRGDGIFVMPVPMEHNALIFYKGVNYTYEISEANSTFIKIHGINADLFNVGDLHEIKVIRMTSMIENMESRVYVHCGLNNRYRNTVDFLLPVCDSLIVYNGVDHEFIVEDDNAIYYPNSAFSITGNLSYISEVLSINFTKV